MIQESIIAISRGASAEEIAESLFDRLISGAQDKVAKLPAPAQSALRGAASKYVTSATPRVTKDIAARAASVLSTPSAGPMDDFKKALLQKGMPTLMKKAAEAHKAASQAKH